MSVHQHGALRYLAVFLAFWVFFCHAGNCGLHNGALILTQPVPNNNGGDPFCFDRTEHGAIIRGIRVYHDLYRIRGLRFYFSDGTDHLAGTEVRSSVLMSWDAFDTKIADIWIWGAWNVPVLGRIAIRVKDSLGRENSFAAGGDTGTSSGIRLDVGDGHLVAVRGRQGSDVDNVEFLFTSAPVHHVDVYDLEFEENLDDWNRNQEGIKATRFNRHHFSNPNDTPEAFTYGGVISERYGRTTTVELSHTLAFNGEAKLKGKIPFVGSADLSYGLKYEFKHVNSEALSEVRTFSQSYSTRHVAAPHSFLRCTARALVGEFSSKFISKVTAYLTNGAQINFSKEGRMVSSGWGESWSVCEVIPKEDIPDGERIYDVTQQGPGNSGPLRNKIMVVGDSISHGADGDFTWRGRVYEWLRSQGHPVEFVGPITGTHGRTPPEWCTPNPPPIIGEREPVTPAVVGIYDANVPQGFAGSGHYSYWGRQAAQISNSLGPYTYAFQPDYILFLLGFNDLGWGVQGPESLVGNVGSLVAKAREGRTDVKILLGNVIHRTFIKGRQDLVDNTNRYNSLLRSTYGSWYHPRSPLTYVDVNQAFQCGPDSCPDGYDGLHPNAQGEYRIAQAFIGSLQRDFGFGGSGLAMPASIPARSIWPPTNVRTLAVPEGFYTTWDNQPLARGYDMRARLQGMTDWWSEGMVYPGTWASWLSWVLEGQTWEFQVRARGENGQSSGWSAITSATARLGTSQGPTGIFTRPYGSDGIALIWKAVEGFDVNRYSIIFWDRDTPDAWIGAYSTTARSYVLTGLKPGHRYDLWVSTYVNMRNSLTGQPSAAGGLPAGAKAVIVGHGEPSASSITAINLEPTTVRLSWSHASGAGHYRIFTTSLTTNKVVGEEIVSGLTKDIGWLVPGTWYYRFCVRAYNGDLPGPESCVTPSVYPGWTKKRAATNSSYEFDSSSLGNATVPMNNTTTMNSTTMMDDTTLKMLYKLYSQNDTMVADL